MRFAKTATPALRGLSVCSPGLAIARVGYRPRRRKRRSSNEQSGEPAKHSAPKAHSLLSLILPPRHFGLSDIRKLRSFRQHGERAAGLSVIGRLTNSGHKGLLGRRP